MLFKLYTEKDVKKMMAKLKAEYDETLQKHREAAEAVKEENRNLRARVLELEGERSGALAVMSLAEREKERAKREGEAVTEAERRELALLSEKCRTMLRRLQAKYPDEEEIASFAAFCAELGQAPEEEEESGFDLEEVTSPKGPLDLEKLCRDLGLMEDDE